MNARSPDVGPRAPVAATGAVKGETIIFGEKLDSAHPIVKRMLASGKFVSGFWAMAVDLWVLVGPENGDGFSGRDVISGTIEEISRLIEDAGGVPHGWRLFKGASAQRFMREAIQSEQARTDW